MHLLTVFGLYLILLVGTELAYRRFKLSPEITRRLSHCVAGLVAAIVPLWMSWQEIVMMSLAFVVVILVARRKKLLGSIHGTARSTIGDLCYPVGIAIAAACYLANSEPLYLFAILCLALADPLANWVGATYGQRLLFKKSLVGSIAFFICAVLIGLTTLPIQMVFPLASAVTFAEAISPYGTDNVSIIVAASFYYIVS